MSIVLERIVKRYDGSAVLDELSLEIADRELFVLLGASGSGKSTVLRLIAGLSSLDGGRILLGGRRVDDLPPQERGVGFVFQSYALFRHMSVAENIEFGLKIRRKRPAERRRRSEQLLQVTGLAGLGDRYPRQLSGGQMQRVALARALAYEPAVLLLDEPFGALDVKIRGQLRLSLRTIQRALKVTTILVTHDQEEAFELGDRIGVMERGRLLEVGRPEDLYRTPKTEYVATFLGMGNVIAGHVEDGRVLLGRVALDIGSDLKPAGGAVSVLARPEDVLVAREPGALEGTPLGRGLVIERTFAGPAERLLVRAEELQGAHAIAPRPVYGESGTVLQALVPRGLSPAPGDEVFLALRGYHVLKRPAVRLLLCSDGSPHASRAVAFGLALARRLDGAATLLGVGEDEHERLLLENWLEEVARLEPHPLEMSVVTRAGVPSDEILIELEDHPFELCVLGSAPGQPIGETAARVAGELRVPVLFVPEGREDVRRILICTAAGEPGKQDIELGGWLARRLGAGVTILHVRPPASGGSGLPSAVPATEDHLEKGLATLGRLTVTGHVKIRYGSVVEEILAEGEGGEHDLIVIGAHGGGEVRAGRLPDDVAHEVATRARLPILLVPLRTG